MASMDSIGVVQAALAILLAVLGAGALARLLRSAVPLPVVQIVLGAAIGFGTPLRIRIDPDAFLLLFLPPLLFLDAWRIPKPALKSGIRTIAELAIGLVLVTVAAVGLFLHWLLPAVPLGLCFALAAVLSPTDAVAVGAIARRVPMPARLRHLLEGEALLNDASALVCLKFATAALVTGRFAWASAAPAFLWMAVAGLVIGAALAWSAGVLSARIATRYGEDPGVHILVTILLPFGAYLLAEAAGASGILGAVGAGLLMERIDHRTGRPDETCRRREATWDMIGFALNGAVFVLLGEQLSLIARLDTRSIVASGADSGWMLAAYVTLVTAVLMVLRALWVWVSLRIDLARRPAAHPFRRPPPALVAASTVAGVRGSVTLVAVLTIPRVAADGTPVPATFVAVTMATGVILLSLLIASIVLPPLLRRLAWLDDTGSTAAD